MLTRFIVIAVALGATLVPADAMKPTRKSAIMKPVDAMLPAATNISYSQSLTIDPVEPEPAEEHLLPAHGPFVMLKPGNAHAGRGEVDWTFACYFSIVDLDGGYWDFSYEARIFDPNNTPIASQTGYVLEKPGYQSDMRRTFTDPIAGTYTCTVDWWINDYQLPRQQATQTISYPLPTGETNVSGGYNGIEDTVHIWVATLTGGSFGGRYVQEKQGYGGVSDNCFIRNVDPPAYEVTPLPDGPFLTLPPTSSYQDLNGWTPTIVGYYRSHLRTPCESYTDQTMVINASGPPTNQMMHYKSNDLRFGITNSTVWFRRADSQPAERIWP